jgi:hypothetical protein
MREDSITSTRLGWRAHRWNSKRRFDPFATPLRNDRSLREADNLIRGWRSAKRDFPGSVRTRVPAASSWLTCVDRRLGVSGALRVFCSMLRVVKRSAPQAMKSGLTRRGRRFSPLPHFVPPQLSQKVEEPPWALSGCTKYTSTASAWPCASIMAGPRLSSRRPSAFLLLIRSASGRCARKRRCSGQL